MVNTGREAMAAANARPIPAPNTLSANPRLPEGKALVTAAAPAENAPPAIPVTQVTAINAASESTVASASTATAAATLTTGMTSRAPYRSASTPAGIRTSEPIAIAATPSSAH
jgi:hypothetical protein